MKTSILRSSVTSAAAVFGIAALAACSPSSTAAPAKSKESAPAVTNAGLTNTALATAFEAAVAKATAMHVSGSSPDAGTTMKMDLQLNADGSAEGTITTGTGVLPLKAIGGVYYFQFTPSYIAMMKTQGTTVPAVVTNKWVSSSNSIGSAIATNFASLLSFSQFSAQMETGSTSDPLTAAGTARVNGQTVAAYTSSKGDKLYFTASGPVFLVEEIASAADGGPGSIDLTWNRPTTVQKPATADIYTG